MTRLFSLFSSSAGNCTCLQNDSTIILIDAGGNCKKISTALQQHGISLNELSGILLTHEHCDHVSALNVLLKHRHIPVFGTPLTLQYLLDHALVPATATLCPIPAGTGGMVGSIAFETFSTLHDASDTCGYTFFTSSGQKIGLATDLGLFTEEVYAALRGSQMVVLESNYDPHMLEVSGYPYPLIRRIKGQFGHLSNEDCAAAALRLAQSGVKRLLLAHTSKQNNLEELAFYTTLHTLQAEGIGERDVCVEVAPKYAPSPVWQI